MTNTSKLAIAALLTAGVAAIAIPTFAQSNDPAAAPVVQARSDGQGEFRRGHQHRGERHGGWRRGEGMRTMRHHAGGQISAFFDTDKDGRVSAEEIAAALTKYDTNQDGTLSLDEFKVLHADMTQQRMVRSFQFLDRDGNAQVTGEEFSEPFERMAKRFENHRDHGPRGPRPGGDRR